MKIFAQTGPPLQALYGMPPEPTPTLQNNLLTILLIAVTPIALVIGLVIYLTKKRSKKKNDA